MRKPIGTKVFGSENYSLVTNFGTKHEANANAKLQRQAYYDGFSRFWCKSKEGINASW